MAWRSDTWLMFHPTLQKPPTKPLSATPNQMSESGKNAIGSRKPADYLEEFRHRRSFGRVMKSHLIPAYKAGAIWQRRVRRAYRDFQNERLEELCYRFEREE